MAVTFLNTTTLNADGLTIPYGTEEARASNVGEFLSLGALRVIEVRVPDLTALSATEANAKILDRNAFLPKGAFIRRVHLIFTTTSTTGSTSLFNLGTCKKDGTTEGDFNGILDSVNLGTNGAATAGVEVDYIVGTSGAGALVGATSGTDAGGYYITASAETAVWTAGALKVLIYYDFGN